MEPLPPRQNRILAMAREAGRVQVDELATEFQVSVQTIRKDLNDLCERKQLQRIHGGAMYPSGVSNFAYESRRILAEEEKRRIGIRAATMIPDNASLIVNIGTTTEQVARALNDHAGLMVVTNNINVANILREGGQAEVIIAGGILRAADGGIVGETTVETIRQFRVDYAVIGASAIDADGTILDYDYREVRVAQEIIRQARHTILVADRTKFERRAPVRLAHLSDIDIFVTDYTPPKEVAEICEAQGVRIETCYPTEAPVEEAAEMVEAVER